MDKTSSPSESVSEGQPEGYPKLEVGPNLDDTGRSKDTADPQGSSSDEENSNYNSDLLDRVSSIVITDLPMPDASEFSVPLPPDFQQDETDHPHSIAGEPRRPLASPPKIINLLKMLKPTDAGGALSDVENVQVSHVGRESGLTGDMQATYLRLPPGTQTSRPLAQLLGDSITYCISGRGLLWQNGWTFPFEATDCAGWKGGTGIAHTIINDSNRDGSPGEDLVLITAHEIRKGEAIFYPLVQKAQGTNLELGGDALWENPPAQGDLGPHPGVPSALSGLHDETFPEPQQGYRPSNIVNAIAELEDISDGELFANATSLAQETGLSGRLGCNFEVLPPGTRSSDPHAHSLEDELVYIISGSGLVWINGTVQPVCEGDAVGFPGGTGIAHNFINDSNADGTEGEPLILWIIGENRVKGGDLIYYPLHIEEKSKSKRWWADCPKYDLGAHNGRPRRPFTRSQK